MQKKCQFIRFYYRMNNESTHRKGEEKIDEFNIQAEISDKWQMERDLRNHEYKTWST